ncbi:hypothetical protein TTHERM_00717880 (macronuclear) [Tetrahymena thermophila SB210]|uniref:Kinase domain protein n=1 Tax=Tetrahymena thermophila (strain SB210) TaxID=312017 RepID=Q23E91_TETTS|nr:hypothetical protein TTHERM_00717880 [Tetrahymena thermophila SB210]EAR94862.2 hypothetical protein TTHERM_00717880 [Tetrahymena thermophila SB210]|eukprot:XP_001015107.2 hypothetical protein TTHERM_00717880 [Tetrahymena thermophila SB210]
MKKNTLQKAYYNSQQQNQEYNAIKISLKKNNQSNIFFVRVNRDGNIINQSQFIGLNKQIEQDQDIQEVKIISMDDAQQLKIEQQSIYETILESLKLNQNVKKLTLHDISNEIQFQEFQEINFLEELEIQMQEQNKTDLVQLESFKQVKISKKLDNQIEDGHKSYFQEIPLIKFQKQLKVFKYNQNLLSNDLIYLSQCNLQHLQILNIKFQIYSPQDIQTLSQAFTNFCNLNTLDLSINSIIKEEINQYFITWKNIQLLTLLNISLPSILIPNLLQGFDDLPLLKRFSINIFNRIDENNAKILGQQIEKIQTLEVFNFYLNNCQLRNQTTKEIFKSFQNQQKLQLFINDENLDQTTVNHIFNVKFKNLYDLDINFNQQHLSLESVKVLKDNLATLQSLKTLHIRCAQANINLIYLILLQINNQKLSIYLNKILFEFNLSKCYLEIDFGNLSEKQFDNEGDQLFQQLYPLLDSNLNHLSLKFGYLDITNKGIKLIAKSLLFLKNLTRLELDIFWNFNISYAELADSISNLKNLKNLKLSPMMISCMAKSLSQIKQQLQTISIYQICQQYEDKDSPQIPSKAKTEPVIQNLFNGLTNFAYIRQLNLQINIQISENNIKLLMSSLNQLNNLNLLQLKFIEQTTSQSFLLKLLKELLNKRQFIGLELQFVLDYQPVQKKKCNDYEPFVSSLIKNRQLTYLKLYDIIDSSDLKNILQIQCIKKLNKLVVFNQPIFNCNYTIYNGGA